MTSVSEFFVKIQPILFDRLELCLCSPLTTGLKDLSIALNVIQIEKYVSTKGVGFIGRPASDRQAVARAFLAKFVLGYTTTEALIDHLRMCSDLRTLCGFPTLQSVPSSATFSRIFAVFARIDLGEIILKAMAAKFAETAKVENISRDSTPLPAREKPVSGVKPVASDKPKRKRGRPKKGELVDPPEQKRLEKQLTQTLSEMLSELPTACDIGSKSNSKGNLQYTIGYKVHIDWACGGIPISVLTTSASLHDCQVASPLMQMTSERISHEYELMDAAYDSQIIRAECERLGFQGIIDTNKRRGPKIQMDEAQAERYKARSVAERGNSQSKDQFGFRNLRVRGHSKVHLHVMFGILSLFALQWQRLLTS